MSTLIKAPQWLHRPCSVPPWIDRVGKKPSMKADLAIYSYVLAWCAWVATMLCYKLDFSSCVIWNGFLQTSHTYKIVTIYTRSAVRMAYILKVAISQ